MDTRNPAALPSTPPPIVGEVNQICPSKARVFRGVQLAVRRIKGQRRACRRHLFSHRDCQAQRHRAAGLHRRCHRKDRQRLARITLGRTRALELATRTATANCSSRLSRGLRDTLTNRCQDDFRAVRSAHAPLPHPGNRQRQLPVQSQRGSTQNARGKSHHLTHPRTAGHHINPGHFSMKIPGQLATEINNLKKHSQRLSECR